MMYWPKDEHEVNAAVELDRQVDARCFEWPDEALGPTGEHVLAVERQYVRAAENERRLPDDWDAEDYAEWSDRLAEEDYQAWAAEADEIYAAEELAREQDEAAEELERLAREQDERIQDM